jgi:hypothetical protein
MPLQRELCEVIAWLLMSGIVLLLLVTNIQAKADRSTIRNLPHYRPRRSMEASLAAWARSSKAEYTNATCAKVFAVYDWDWFLWREVTWDNGRWYRQTLGVDVDKNFAALGWVVESVMPSWHYANKIKGFPPGPSCGPNCTYMTTIDATVWHLCAIVPRITTTM